MRLPRWLGRLLGHDTSDDAEKARYAAADDLEQRTQAHYRGVTGVDAEGRPIDRRRGVPRRSRED